MCILSNNIMKIFSSDSNEFINITDQSIANTQAIIKASFFINVAYFYHFINL